MNTINFPSVSNNVAISSIEQYLGFLKKHPGIFASGSAGINPDDISAFENAAFNIQLRYDYSVRSEKAHRLIKPVYIDAPSFIMRYCDNSPSRLETVFDPKSSLESVLSAAGDIFSEVGKGPLCVSDRIGEAIIGTVRNVQADTLRAAQAETGDAEHDTKLDKAFELGDLAWEVAMGDYSGLLEKIQDPSARAQVEKATWEQIASNLQLRNFMGIDKFMFVSSGYVFSYAEAVAVACGAPQLSEDIQKIKSSVTPLTKPQEFQQQLTDLKKKADEAYNEDKFKGFIRQVVAETDQRCRGVYAYVAQQLPGRLNAFGAYLEGRVNGSFGADFINFDYVRIALNRQHCLAQIGAVRVSGGRDKEAVEYVSDIAKRMYASAEAPMPDLSTRKDLKSFEELVSGAELSPRQRELVYCAIVHHQFYDEYLRVNRNIRARRSEIKSDDDLRKVKAEELGKEGLKVGEHCPSENINQWYIERYPYAALARLVPDGKDFDPAVILGISPERAAELNASHKTRELFEPTLWDPVFSEACKERFCLGYTK